MRRQGSRGEVLGSFVSNRMDSTFGVCCQVHVALTYFSSLLDITASFQAIKVRERNGVGQKRAVSMTQCTAAGNVEVDERKFLLDHDSQDILLFLIKVHASPTFLGQAESLN